MTGKRLRLAKLIGATGLSRLIANSSPASLLVLNFHRLRVADSHQSNFDDGVFDTDFESFRRQMAWLKSATVVLDQEGMLELGGTSSGSRGALYSAITFDDGYIECFTLVKPVLEELGIRGTFFIPFEMIDSRRLGWWDLSAFLLKRTRHRTIRIDGNTYELGERSLQESLRRILAMFKLENAERTQDMLEKLSEACDVSLPEKDIQSAELMDWAQVRELRAAGHAIGSHAMSHRVLATLDPLVQKREIYDSKRELEAVIGDSVLSFAYPVGGLRHFNEYSTRFVREAGYHQAFTFNTGMAALPIADRYRIPRESAHTFDVLKAKALLPGVMGIRNRQAV